MIVLVRVVGEDSVDPHADHFREGVRDGGGSAPIDKSGGEVGQLSADQRKLVAGLINPLMPAFNQLCDKVLAIPGVAEVLKPSVDAVKAKLTTLVA